jgi:hypothetical protein
MNRVIQALNTLTPDTIQRATNDNIIKVKYPRTTITLFSLSTADFLLIIFGRNDPLFLQFLIIY